MCRFRWQTSAPVSYTHLTDIDVALGIYSRALEVATRRGAVAIDPEGNVYVCGSVRTAITIGETDVYKRQSLDVSSVSLRTPTVVPLTV